jgi:hypothetical protein
MKMETLLKSSAEFDALVKSIKLSDDVMIRAVSSDFRLTFDELLAKFCPYWRLGKPVLEIVKILTPPKVDNAIDEVVAICDKLCGDATPDERSVLLEKFAEYWPVVGPVFVKVKDFTGPKADKIIDEIIIIGNLLSA